jgi:hypothetical protein
MLLHLSSSKDSKHLLRAHPTIAMRILYDVRSCLHQRTVIWIPHETVILGDTKVLGSFDVRTL